MAKYEVKIWQYGDQYYIDAGNNLCVIAVQHGFAQTTLEIKEIPRTSMVVGYTMYFDTLEDAHYIATEYLKRRDVRNMRTQKI